MISGDDLITNEVVSFGPFRLSVAERLLVRADGPVTLGSRAIDVLIALVEQAGQVVSKRELIDRAWPDVTVEEANLRVHVAHLRKALGDSQDGARYIANVPGRGYCFVGRVQRSAQTELPAATAASLTKPHSLPLRLQRMVGRDASVAALGAQLASQRFVSIVGPGGIGKTTVAVAVAHTMVDDFGGAVFFVDLGAINDPALVVTTVASALGYFPQTQDLLPGLLAFLADRRILFVLDSCEHVIAAVSTWTERIFAEAPTVYLLTTSREALRVEGETMYLLQPLDNPREDMELTAAEALASSAVQLFMERAAAGGYHAELSDAQAPTVAGICRRLDGIALAIELVASRVGTYGIGGTAALVDGRLKLLWQGRRNALPRHHTLQAMLDWSYNLLSEYEAKILCNLSLFVGGFTLEAAQAVADEAGNEAQRVADAIASLVDKSLVRISALGDSTYFRLLDTTRAYAAAKLAETGEAGAAARRHALYYTNYLERDAIAASASVDHLSAYSPHIGNVRAALEWSFSGAGDPNIGIDLCARWAFLFLGVSLLGECRFWCQRALARLNDSARGTKRELVLQEALAICSHFTSGDSDEVRAAIERGLELAKALGDDQPQLHLLAGLNFSHSKLGEFGAALAVAERYGTIAEKFDRPRETVIAEWMLGNGHHLVGNQAAAQAHYELGFKLASASSPIHVSYFGYDHHIRALVGFARTLWLLGLPEQAVKMAHLAVNEAEKRDHPVSLGICLLTVTPVFLWSGDSDRAEGLIERLITQASKYSLASYCAGGLALKGELMIIRGKAAEGIELLRSAIAALHAAQLHIVAAASSSALSNGLAQYGELQEAMVLIDAALARSEQCGGRYDLPHLLRLRGEILLALPQPDPEAAEQALQQSLERAHTQSALGWELRTAIVLARLWLSQGRGGEAQEMLGGIYRRFTEGYATSDLVEARRLMKLLEASTSRTGVETGSSQMRASASSR